MKYLDRLFAYTDRLLDQGCSSSATFTSNLYSVTFVPNSGRHLDLHVRSGIDSSKQEQQQATNRSENTSQADSIESHNKQAVSSGFSETTDLSREQPVTRFNSQGSGTPCNRWRYSKATINDRRRVNKVNTSTERTSSIDKHRKSSRDTSSPDSTRFQVSSEASHLQEESDQDWIIVDPLGGDNYPVEKQTPCSQHQHKQQLLLNTPRKLTQFHDMALSMTDIELIRASWVSMRKDPLAAGILLFKE